MFIRLIFFFQYRITCFCISNVLVLFLNLIYTNKYNIFHLYKYSERARKDTLYLGVIVDVVVFVIVGIIKL